MIIPAARILSERSHIVPGELRVIEHFFQVPRDYANPSQGTIQIFARSARKVGKNADYTLKSQDDPKKNQLPWLVYLQGGPGFECRSPQNASWVPTMIDRGYQILMLDQRGTGLSTAVSHSSLQLVGKEKQQVDYLKCFRADSIVKDCEAIRKALTVDYPKEKKKWSVIGQSFGGFCITTYLSFFPEGLKEAFLFGGLPPLRNDPDEVYTCLYERVRQRNEAYYSKYPEDVARVHRVLQYFISKNDSAISVQGSQGHWTARRFLQLGISFGRHGGIDDVHNLVLRADTDLAQFERLTGPTLLALEGAQSFDSNVIYTLLHEPIYCQNQASNWSAERTMLKFPEFSLSSIHDGKPVFFTGETIHPFMLSCYPELIKLERIGNALAEVNDWPTLYDEERLRKNEVPTYAAVYFDDMYVDFDLSMETARTIKGCKTFVTNTMYHDAIGAKTDVVLKEVLKLRDDVID